MTPNPNRHGWLTVMTWLAKLCAGNVRITTIKKGPAISLFHFCQ